MISVIISINFKIFIFPDRLKNRRLIQLPPGARFDLLMIKYKSFVENDAKGSGRLQELKTENASRIILESEFSHDFRKRFAKK